MNSLPLFRELQPVQHFAAKTVSRELAVQLLQDAVWAPNHKIREPWRFIYADGEAKQKLAASIDRSCHGRLAETITLSPAVLILTSRLHSDAHVSREDFAAVCCLIQNFRLLAWTHELGVAWELADYSDCNELLSLAGVQPDERIAGVLGLGYKESGLLSIQPAASLSYEFETW